MATKKLELQLIPSVKDGAEMIALPEAIFSVTASPRLLAQYVHVFLANQKRNTAVAQTRGEVSKSTRKIYKQKGTGRARHGSLKAPIFVGGGVAHGPKLDGQKLVMPKKMRQRALFAALTLKLKEKGLFVIKDAVVAKIQKTKEAAAFIAKNFPEIKKQTFFVFEKETKNKSAFANLTNLEIGGVSALNAYLVLNKKNILFTEKSLAEFVSLFIK